MKSNSIIKGSLSLLPAIFLLAVLIAAVVNARDDGMTGRTLMTNTNGCNCHGSRDLNTSVLISGPAVVNAGQTYNYNVSISNLTKNGAGVDLAAKRGVLVDNSPVLHLSGSELTHDSNLTMTSGLINIQFTYTAPANPTVDTIYATGNATNSNGSTTGDGWNWAPNFRVTVIQPVTLNLTALPEGFYNSGTGSSTPDTMTVYLRNATSPYSVVDVAKSEMNSLGQGTFTFTNAVNGTPYYIVLTHRNSIETWSSAAISFVSNSLTYDFTSASSQAYGSNMKLLGSEWTIFAGDVNQDGTVDGSDTQMIDNDAFNFNSGYLATDVNGDSFVDGSDSQIAGNNSDNFVSKITP